MTSGYDTQAREPPRRSRATKTKEVSGVLPRRPQARLTFAASPLIFSSSELANDRTESSIPLDSTLLRVMRGQTLKIWRSCSPTPHQRSTPVEQRRVTYESDDREVRGVLLENMAHQVETMESEELTLNLLVRRHLQPDIVSILPTTPAHTELTWIRESSFSRIRGVWIACRTAAATFGTSSGMIGLRSG
jgi:hypothetical protein